MRGSEGSALISAIEPIISSLLPDVNAVGAVITDGASKSNSNQE
jgi:hypothetical protein